MSILIQGQTIVCTLYKAKGNLVLGHYEFKFPSLILDHPQELSFIDQFLVIANGTNDPPPPHTHTHTHIKHKNKETNIYIFY